MIFCEIWEKILRQSYSQAVYFNRPHSTHRLTGVYCIVNFAVWHHAAKAHLYDNRATIQPCSVDRITYVIVTRCTADRVWYVMIIHSVCCNTTASGVDIGFAPFRRWVLATYSKWSHTPHCHSDRTQTATWNDCFCVSGKTSALPPLLTPARTWFLGYKIQCTILYNQFPVDGVDLIIVYYNYVC